MESLPLSAVFLLGVRLSAGAVSTHPWPVWSRAGQPTPNPHKSPDEEGLGAVSRDLPRRLHRLGRNCFCTVQLSDMFEAKTTGSCIPDGS